MAMVGSAIGLGNLWRFPYLVGTNGGAAFILIYLVAIVLLCLPALYAEFVVGRRSQSSPVAAFDRLVPGTAFKTFGWLGLVICFLLLGFYPVVGGWTLNYLGRSLAFHLISEDTALMTSVFENVSSSVWMPLGCFLLFMGVNFVIVVLGVQKGIEKFSSFMTPALFVLILVMVVYSATFPGAGAGYRFLFRPDFSAVTVRTFSDAIGQAFLSLSLGCGTIMIYASYADKRQNIASTGLKTALLDTFFAILAGCAIMPAVFAFGISPSEGPGLVFIALPSIFAKMPGGQLIAVLFFFVLFLAALTSSISMLEVLTGIFIEQFRLTRRKALLCVSAIVLVLGSLCSLSLAPASPLKVGSVSVFDLFNNLSSMLLPIGALMVVVFVGWKLPWSETVDELTSGGLHRLPAGWLKALAFMLRYVTPLLLLAMIVAGFMSI